MRPRPHTAECAEVDMPVLGCPGTTRPGSGSSSRIPLSSCVCVTLTRAILQYWIINRVPACLRGRGEDGVRAEHLAAAQRSRGPVFLGTPRPPTVVRPTPLPSSPQGSVTDGDTPPPLGTTRCSYDKTDWLSPACQAAHPYLCLTQSHLGAPRSRRRSVRFLRGPCQPPPPPAGSRKAWATVLMCPAVTLDTDGCPAWSCLPHGKNRELYGRSLRPQGAELGAMSRLQDYLSPRELVPGRLVAQGGRGAQE